MGRPSVSQSKEASSSTLPSTSPSRSPTATSHNKPMPASPTRLPPVRLPIATETPPPKAGMTLAEARRSSKSPRKKLDKCLTGTNSNLTNETVQEKFLETRQNIFETFKNVVEVVAFYVLTNAIYQGRSDTDLEKEENYVEHKNEAEDYLNRVFLRDFRKMMPTSDGWGEVRYFF